MVGNFTALYRLPELGISPFCMNVMIVFLSFFLFFPLPPFLPFACIFASTGFSLGNQWRPRKLQSSKQQLSGGQE